MQPGKKVSVTRYGHAARLTAKGSETPKYAKWIVSGWLVMLLLAPLLCPAQTKEALPEDATAIPLAPVILDGETLFAVRGTSALPAERRAAAIADRIRAAAKDPAYVRGSLAAVEGDAFTKIEARGQLLVTLTDADAAAESVARSTLVRVAIARIDEAIAAYRQARSRQALVRAGLNAGATLAAFAGFVFLFLWIYRKGEIATKKYCETRVEKIRARALPVVEAERLWIALRNALRLMRAVVVLAAGMIAANLILSQFPWTKPFSHSIFGLVFNPLKSMGLGLVRSLPDIAFLVILFFVIRYLLKLIGAFFEAVKRGTVTIAEFEPEWAGPTFRIVRILVIAFGLIVAYPYLPGSSSEAFKGVSLFIGVIFSLGSTGMISNIMAGYSLTYRRAYKVGDRVQIGDIIGDVEYTRLQVTHLRSLKNEEIIIPNSTILSSSVINYTSLAKKHGLILHTTVGIGYETPWRQVEAMLLLAAERTPLLLRQPPPFVMHRSLGDFCVTYELNVYCDRPGEQMRLYTALHRNILDVFNEYGVQIMTPAYEGDPQEPKVVPKEKWFESPAKPSLTPGK